MKQSKFIFRRCRSVISPKLSNDETDRRPSIRRRCKYVNRTAMSIIMSLPKFKEDDPWARAVGTDSRDLPPGEQPSPGFPSRERSPGGRLNSSPFLSRDQRAGGRLLLRTHRPITGFSRLGRRRCAHQRRNRVLHE